MKEESEQSYTFGTFLLDPIERSLTRSGKNVPLTQKAFETLLMLVRHSGHVVKKEELMKAIWADTFVEESNLAQNIFKLRKVLREGGRRRRYIETVPRLGYRFIASVRELPDTGAEGESRRLTVDRRREPRTENNIINSIAVLPFANNNNDPTLEYLSDGIAESIINNLSRLPRLRVMARSTTFRYRGPEVDAWKVGRRLNVGAVLMGRVCKFGKNIVTGAELVDVTDGSQVWGEKYQHPFSNILAAQEEIAREVSQKLRLKLSHEEERLLAKRHTNSPEAYRLYLKGRFFLNKRTGEGLKKSVEYFRRAIETDDRYVLAYAGLADSFFVHGAYKILPPNEAYPMAKEAVLTALKLDDTLAEAHTSLAHISMIYEWDWAAAEKEYRRAVELNPNCAASHHWYSIYLRVRGQFEESLAEIETALRLEPVSLTINSGLGAHFYFARRPDRAIAQFSKTIELDVNFPYAHFMLGLAHGQKGKYEKAITELRKAIRLLGNNSEVLSRLGYLYASAKRRSAARMILQKLKELRKRRYVAAYDVAVVYAALGEKERAFAWLQTAFAEHDEGLCQLGIDSTIDSLRSDPRFTDLLYRVGLPTSLSGTPPPPPPRSKTLASANQLR
jgi:TolB-like protein/Tfp pilus assembly protein PilF